MDHAIGRVDTALLLDLTIRRRMMVVVPVVIKAGLTIMVRINISNKVDIMMVVAHDIIVVHDIMMVHDMTTVANNTVVMVSTGTKIGLVIFTNPLERRTQTPPSQ